MLIDEIGQKTNIRFSNFDDFEAYIFAIDIDYDGENVHFRGWF